MNNNSKKSIFTKKNIIIGVGILAVLIIILIISFSSISNKNKIGNIICSFDYDYEFADATINMDVVYTTEMVETIQYQIKYEITDDTLKENMDLFEQKFKETLESSMSERTDLKFTRNENKFEVSYFIDYVNFNEDDIKASELFGLESENEITEMTIEKLKTQVNEMNGSCVEVGNR